MTALLIRLFVRRPEHGNDAATRRQIGALSGGVGIVLNLLLSAGKLIAGALSGSIAVTADGVNNLSDAVSGLVTLVGFRMAARKSDSDHPFGHGRAEYLAGLFVSALILLVGFELGRSSVERILRPEPVVFDLLTAMVLGISAAVKLWLFCFNRTLAGRIGSAAMRAAAADSLSDAGATAVLFIGGLAGSSFGLQIDGYLGILVAVLILRAGWSAIRDTVDPLLGRPADPEMVRQISETVLSYPEVLGIHDLVIHDYGPGRCMVSLHAEVAAESDFSAAHEVIDTIELALHAQLGAPAVIHMDPVVTADARVSEARAKMTELVTGLGPALSIHDFRMTAGQSHITLIFDVVVPFDFSIPIPALRRAIADGAKAIDPRYDVVLQIDRSYLGDT